MASIKTGREQFESDVYVCFVQLNKCTPHLPIINKFNFIDVIYPIETLGFAIFTIATQLSIKQLSTHSIINYAQGNSPMYLAAEANYFHVVSTIAKSEVEEDSKSKPTVHDDAIQRTRKPIRMTSLSQSVH